MLLEITLVRSSRLKISASLYLCMYVRVVAVKVFTGLILCSLAVLTLLLGFHIVAIKCHFIWIILIFQDKFAAVNLYEAFIFSMSCNTNMSSCRVYHFFQPTIDETTPAFK